MFYPLAAIMSSLLPVRTNVPGVRWSRYLYMAVTGMTGLNEMWRSMLDGWKHHLPLLSLPHWNLFPWKYFDIKKCNQLED